MVHGPKDGEVCVWLVSVAESIGLYGGLLALLSAEERERASRYVHKPAQHEFVAGRGCLRLLLGLALGEAPQQVTLTTGEHGKLRAEGVEFNLSHAQGLIAIAVSRSGPVGIDIEWEDRRVELLDVAHSVFAAEELAALQAAPQPEARRHLFFRMWTAMEAKAKCLGLGIAHPGELRRYTDRLKVRQLTLPEGYQGALCLYEQEAVTREQFLGNAAIAWLLRRR